VSRVGITFFPSLRDAAGKRGSGSWKALVSRLSQPRVVAQKDKAPGFAIATFKNDRRSLVNVEHVFAVGLDLDHLDGWTWEDVAMKFDGADAFVHTTYSSTPEAPRVRAFLRLSRGVTADEYRRVYAACVAVVEAHGLVVDRAASDPSRFWYLPSIPPAGRYLFSVGSGPAVDVDAALLAVPSKPVAPVAPPPPSRAATPDVEERAARYLALCDVAISGQDGHKTTFNICQKIVRGFALDEATAYRLLCSWNERCQPPWTERDLKRKIQQAAERGTMPWGELRDRERAA
jgi:hypothetical protein